MISYVENLNTALCKSTVSKIEKYFIRIFTQLIIYSNLFDSFFGHEKCWGGNTFGSRKICLNSDCVIILKFVWVENSLENVDRNGSSITFSQNCLNYANKCSHADITICKQLCLSRATYSNILAHSNKQMADPQIVYTSR